MFDAFGARKVLNNKRLSLIHICANLRFKIIINKPACSASPGNQENCGIIEQVILLRPKSLHQSVALLR